MLYISDYRDNDDFEEPIQEVRKIYANESGRYETEKGYYYTMAAVLSFKD